MSDYEWELYDVCQISRDGGASWLDFATVKNSLDAYYAVKCVDGTHAEFSNDRDQYRIVRHSQGQLATVYPLPAKPARKPRKPRQPKAERIEFYGAAAEDREYQAKTLGDVLDWLRIVQDTFGSVSVKKARELIGHQRSRVLSELADIRATINVK